MKDDEQELQHEHKRGILRSAVCSSSSAASEAEGRGVRASDTLLETILPL